LLSAYPMAQKYLDYKKLNLKSFVLGSYIFKNGKQSCIGDPLRDVSLLWPTLSSSIGSFSDKLKVFKMFGEGEAVVPKNGIQEIPNQLLSRLNRSSIKYKHNVDIVKEHAIVFRDGSEVEFDYCIVATEASAIIPNMANAVNGWKSTQTLYFEVDTSTVFSKHMIGLLAHTNEVFINSISFPFSENQPNKLLSVSVIKQHNFNEGELVKRITDELKSHFNITIIQHLKTYNIKKALPNLDTVSCSVYPSEMQLTNSIYLAGDTLLNGSLNAAMLSGELAAKAIHEKITEYVG